MKSDNPLAFENYEQALKNFKALIEESDRGSVLIIASRLDSALEELHDAYISSIIDKPKKLVEELTKTFGPISTFSARIKLAYAYGLISSDDYQDLEIIRKMRNDVAHGAGEFFLSAESVKSQVFRLKPKKEGLTNHPVIGEFLSNFGYKSLEPDHLKSNMEWEPKLYFITCGFVLELIIMDKALTSLNRRKAVLEGKK